MENNEIINVQMTKEVFETLGSGGNGGGSGSNTSIIDPKKIELGNTVTLDWKVEITRTVNLVSLFSYSHFQILNVNFEDVSDFDTIILDNITKKEGYSGQSFNKIYLIKSNFVNILEMDSMFNISNGRIYFSGFAEMQVPEELKEQLSNMDFLTCPILNACLFKQGDKYVISAVISTVIP